MKTERLAAIDIGSNAVRLLIANVYYVNDSIYIRKANLLRVPIRLGEEVFKNGRISDYRRDKLVKTMHIYDTLMDVYEVKDYRGCATSAMREASNGKNIAHQIKSETGIDIEIIYGRKEAEIIYSTQLQQIMKHGTSYLFVDVGGGSTELTFFSGNESHFSKSFDIGTLRLRNDQVEQSHWDSLSSWLLEMQEHINPDVVIGSGGNINKIFKLLNKAPEQKINTKELNEMTLMLEKQTMKDLVIDMELRPDRADVIVHACHIFQFIMKQSHCDEILVPKIGLADGIIYGLYEEEQLVEKKK